MAVLRNYFINDINSTNKMYPKVKASQVYIPSLNKTLEEYYGSETLTFQQIIDILLPVGFIYKTTKEIDLENFDFGNETIQWTWGELEPGNVLISEGSYTDSAGDTATFAYGETAVNEQPGELWHLLTVSEMPSHLHYMPYVGTDDGRNHNDIGHGKDNSSHYTAHAGGQTPHNNIQPVKVVHMYQRLS